MTALPEDQMLSTADSELEWASAKRSGDIRVRLAEPEDDEDQDDEDTDDDMNEDVWNRKNVKHNSKQILERQQRRMRRKLRSLKSPGISTPTSNSARLIS
eukprot:GHVS01047013.1.p1 GENE.GHVS01047013.1~~GHVS01047013.1.p1  ORF type:complete len:100 (+),score=18.77 GHVS01047013.1:274-573(+)